MIHLTRLNSIYNRQIFLLQVPQLCDWRKYMYVLCHTASFRNITYHTQKNVRKYIRFDVKFMKHEIDKLYEMNFNEMPKKN